MQQLPLRLLEQCEVMAVRLMVAVSIGSLGRVWLGSRESLMGAPGLTYCTRLAHPQPSPALLSRETKRQRLNSNDSLFAISCCGVSLLGFLRIRPTSLASTRRSTRKRRQKGLTHNVSRRRTHQPALITIPGLENR